MVFCAGINKNRTTASSRTPPAAGNPNSVRLPIAPARVLVRPAALPKNTMCASIFASSGTVPTI
jgi:hypothetical protein